MGVKLVKDLMITELIMIEPHAALYDGLKLMREHNKKAIIVNKGRPGDAYGILQYRDVANAIIKNDGDLELLNVYDVVTKPVIQVSKELESKYVLRLMLEHGIKRILVVDNNQLEGLITMSDVIGDVIDLAIKEQEE